MILAGYLTGNPGYFQIIVAALHCDSPPRQTNYLVALPPYNCKKNRLHLFPKKVKSLIDSGAVYCKYTHTIRII